MTNGDFSFESGEDGTFRYCFSNVLIPPNDFNVKEFDHYSAKEVTFNVHGIIYVPVVAGDADPLEREVRTLGELLQQVKDEQEYIKVRERTHRNSMSHSCTG